MTSAKSKQLRYLSQAFQLEEAANPFIVRSTMAVISIAIVSFTVWAGLTNINEVARTSGEVMPSGYQQVVQHLEGGIVRKIVVKEGDIVEQGQILVLLDSAGVAEDLERSRLRQLTLSLQEERLRAYLDGRKPDFSSFSKDHADLVRDQDRFFLSTGNADREERQVISRQIEQKKQMISSLRAEMATEESNLKISAALFGRKRKLREQGYLSESRYLEAQKSMNQIRGNISQIKYRIAAAESEIGEFQNRLSSLGLDQKDQINEKLNAIIAERQQNDEILAKISGKSNRLEIRAPVSGIIKGLAVNTVGAVIRPGETIMEIVPTDGDLIVQVKIMPQNIGHVKTGQPVKVKFSSYDFSRYGLADGHLEQISATTFKGENGERYYQGYIKLDRNYVGKGEQNPVMPGMTVMTEIITGRKTILQYLLKPIHNSLTTAFSER